MKQAIVNQGPVVTEEMKQILNTSFTRVEVKTAMWDIDSRKALGPDVFGSAFHKGAWENIGHEVSYVLFF